MLSFHEEECLYLLCFGLEAPRRSSRLEVPFKVARNLSVLPFDTAKRFTGGELELVIFQHSFTCSIHSTPVILYSTVQKWNGFN